METCPQCSRPYGKRRRCYYCQPGRAKTSTIGKCATCGKAIDIQPNQTRRGEGRFCSVGCKAESARGVVKVVGTKYVTTNGYMSVKTGLRQRELEHRIVAAQAIGRALLPSEQVHHINGDKLDNRPENLQVLTNAEHQRLHGHPQTKPRRIAMTCEECGEPYERPASRAKTSRCCGNECRLALLHKTNKRT